MTLSGRMPMNAARTLHVAALALVTGCALLRPSAARADLDATMEAIQGVRRVQVQVNQRTQDSSSQLAGTPSSDISTAYEDDVAILSVGSGPFYIAGIGHSFLAKTADNLTPFEVKYTRDAASGVLRWDFININLNNNLDGLRLFVTGNSAVESSTFNISAGTFLQTVKVDETETVLGALYGIAGIFAIGGAVGTRDLSIHTQDSLGNATADNVYADSQQVAVGLNLGPVRLFYVEDQTPKKAGGLYTFDSDATLSRISIGDPGGRGFGVSYQVRDEKRHITTLQTQESQNEDFRVSLAFDSFSFSVTQRHTLLSQSAVVGAAIQQADSKFDSLLLQFIFFY